ncbi:hypothetical protein [Paraflavitalea pollutisoli]|uniref:hypothetical protein n=1 Tax=Paraflavitalea pollutisoli TaxID=3034143 RepID=UPI0023ECD319|nr:hypothetical protein [Paraflavitalea sp. H1-2-19X]
MQALLQVEQPKTTFIRVGNEIPLKFSFLIQKAPFFMKRVKIMLTSVLALAVVAGAVAFKVKTDNVCAWAKLFPTTVTTPSTTLFSTDRVTTIPGIRATTTTTANVYALTQVTTAAECPTTPVIGLKSKTIANEE